MMDDVQSLKNCTGFQWDEMNVQKNWLRHRVTASECEQVFFNLPLIACEDAGHSEKEERYYVLGKTDAERFLYIVFTVRKKQIRIISARDMNKKERQVYVRNERDS